MSGVLGNVRRLRDIAKGLKGLSTGLSHRIAGRVASRLSTRVRTAYVSGQTAYGDARPLGKYGPVTLNRTGVLLSTLKVVAVGAMVRAALSTKYARYMVGRFKVLPMGAIPTTWSQDIAKVAGEEIRAALASSAGEQRRAA